MAMIDLTWNGPEANDEFFALKRMVFPPEAVERKMKVWNWLFAHPYEGPWGKTYCILIRSKGIAVGAQILLPTRVIVNGIAYEGVSGMSTMVHPDHRGAGIRLIKVGFGENAAPATIGFAANEKLNEFFVRLGAALTPKRTLRRKVYRLGTVMQKKRTSLPNSVAQAIDVAASLPLSLLNLRRPRLAKGESIDPVDRFTEEFDIAWRQIEQDITFAMDRRSAFLNWRYVEMPILTYKRAALRRDNVLLGYIVICIQQDHGVVVGRVTDIFTYNGAERDYALLMSWADRQFAHANCARGEVVFGVNDALDRAAVRSGFVSCKRIREVAVNITDPTGRAGLDKALESFHFCRGDQDEDY